MSDRSRPTDDPSDAPRVESWLVVSTASIVPLAAAFFVPRAVQTTHWIVGGAMLVIGVAMCVAHARRPHGSADVPAARREEAA